MMHSSWQQKLLDLILAEIKNNSKAALSQNPARRLYLLFY